MLKAKRKFKLVVKNKHRKLVKRVRRKQNQRLIKSLNSLAVLTNQKYKNQLKPVETRALNADEITVGNAVNVNMGKGNMAATIVEINKDDVRVQLANGLQMVVKAEHLRA